MQKILKNLSLAVGLTSIMASTALADVTFFLTPYDLGDVEIVGGTITTDGTTGTNIALGDIITDWSIVLTDGIDESILDFENSGIVSNTGAGFDVTPYDITFNPSSLAVFQIKLDSPGSDSYTWYFNSGTSILELKAGGTTDSVSPAPGGVGNVAVPEPSTVALWMAGIVGAFVFWQTRRK